MKELFKGSYALIGAIIVSVPMFTIGLIYTIGYGLWFSRKAKKYHPVEYFFRFIWRIIDGCLAAIGHLFYELGYCLDLMWNMLGEILEDLMTHKEDTEFTKKNVSVSASIGKLEIDGDLNKFGRWFSKILNFAFGQKSHARGAWEWLQFKNKNKDKYFNK